MTKQDFEEKYKEITTLSNEKYEILSKKYSDIYYCSEEEALKKYGDDYPVFFDMMNLSKEAQKLFYEFQNVELKNKNFPSKEGMDLSIAIEVHDILLEKEFYKKHLKKEDDFDFVKVVYHCLYNDNWNDLLVAKLLLYKNRNLSKEIVIFDESEFMNNIDDEDGLYYAKQNFEIEMYSCKIYSNNEAYQSFVISKDKCDL